MIEKTITIKVKRCPKCGHEWRPYREDSVTCPLCHFRFDRKYKSLEKRMQYCQYKIYDQYGNVFCGKNEGSVGTCSPDLCPLNLEKKGDEGQPTRAGVEA